MFLCRVSYLVLAFLHCVFALPPAKRWSLQHHEGKDRRGAVASESAVCSRVGTDLLKQGGNAADAVCTLSCHFWAGAVLIGVKLVGTVFCVGVIGITIRLVSSEELNIA